MLKVGITGNIAAGKSEVEKIISKLGFLVFDLDKITHFLLENDKKIQTKILKIFQTLDRKEISKVAFSDKNKLKLLEEIIHPELRLQVLKIFNQNKNQDKVFVSGALLYEAGFDKLFDKIIFVDAQYLIRLQRLMKRNNFSIAQADERLKSQNLIFKDRADFLIQNDSTVNEL